MTIDGQNVRGPAASPEAEGEPYRRQHRDNQRNSFTWPRRTAVDLENMATDAFGRVDEIHKQVLNEEQPAQVEADVEGDDEGNEVNFEYLVQESSQNVFEGSTQNRLQCAIVLFSLCSLYSVSHTFVDALLQWISGDLLPTSNCFPRTSYEVKTMLMKLGLEHRQVHCCSSGHVLYEGDYEDLSHCPTCGEPCYIPGSNTVPQRVVRYFDVIKHLLRMFKCPEIAKHMTWHSNHKSRGHKMRSVIDSS